MLTGMCCDGCGMCSDGFAGQLLSWGFADLLVLAVLLLPAVAAAHGQAAMHGYQCRLHSMGGAITSVHGPGVPNVLDTLAHNSTSLLLHQ